MTAVSVLLGTAAKAMVCLSLMALATAGALAFVLVVKPFADGDQSSVDADEMTRADKTQALSLGATLVAIAIGFTCLLIPDRSDTVDGVIASVIAVVAVIPIAMGLWEKYRKHKEKKKRKRARETEPEPEPELEVETTSNPMAAQSSRWTQKQSRQHGRPYWVDRETGKSTWTKPKSDELDNLPEGWVEKEHESRPYYVNATTRERVWTRPTSSGVAAPRAARAQRSATSSCVEKYSEQHRRPYWVHKQTGSKTWTTPEEARHGGGRAASAASGGTATASVWVEKFSREHQRPYWHNTETGKSTWSDPHRPGSARGRGQASAERRRRHSPRGKASGAPFREWEL